MESSWLRGTIESLPTQNRVGCVITSSGQELAFTDGAYTRDLETGKIINYGHDKSGRLLKVGDEVIVRADRVLNTSIYRAVEFYKK